MSFGLTEKGFNLKRLEDIQEETRERWESEFGEGFDLDPRRPAGQIKAILDERMAILWELAQSLYSATYPSTSFGVALDLAVQFTGISRLPASPTTVDSGKALGVFGTTVPQGTIISVAGNPNARFVTDADIEINNPAQNEIQKLTFAEQVDAGDFQLIFDSETTSTLAFNISSAALQSALEALSNIGAGNVTVTGATTKNEIQRLDFSSIPDAGQYTLNLDGFITNSIDFNDPASIVQAELEALGNVGNGNVFVTGDYSSGFKIEFVGDKAQEDIPEITINANTLTLSSNPVTITPSTTQDGSEGFTIEFVNSLGDQDQNPLIITNNNLTESSNPVTASIDVIQEGSVPFSNPVSLTAEDEGPITVNANSLSVIETPVVGLDAFTNTQSGSTGRFQETDAELKLRQVQEVQVAGAATLEAIRADLLAVTAVTNVRVFQNKSNIVDSDGLPPKSIEAVVRGGNEDEIALALFNTVAAGVGTFGTITKNLEDTQGFLQEINFSRPTPVDIFVEIELTVDTTVFQIQNNQGINTVKEQIIEYGDQLDVGDDVVVFGSEPSLSCSFQDVSGIKRYSIKVGKTASPTNNDNIEIAPREIPSFTTNNIKVVIV